MEEEEEEGERADCILSKMILRRLLEKRKFEQCLFFFFNGHAAGFSES